MMATPLSSLKAALWIIKLISTTAYAQREWFGSAGQYKCHCTGNNCDNNGNCTNGVGCVKGWFGPQCQYADLTHTENDGTTREEFRDSDDKTCNEDRDHQTVIMNFRKTLPFTWLRLLFHADVTTVTGLSLDSTEVTFTDGGGNNNIQCTDRKSALIDSHTIDIHCYISEEVEKITVTGVAIGYLCSFYVSGGRNVALKQDATQSSTDYNKPAEFAVDGDNNQNFYQGTCTHTNGWEVNANWNVQLSKPSDVNRYMIYNRKDSNSERLKGFVLTAYNQNNAVTFTYLDQNPQALSVYNITTAVTKSVKKVKIEAKSQNNDPPILTLCEVEVYGDTACTVVNYGRECEHECHCANSEPCFVSIGRCPSGCANGYTGIHCDQSCRTGYYGAGCNQQCSQNCDGGLCQTDNGYCNGCKAGWEGTFCNSECQPTYYGKGCKSQCNTNCKDQKCNRVDGKCVSCIAGKMGEFCGTPCSDGYYGEGCRQQCNQNCDQGRCQADNGHCIECNAGWEGTFCEKQCDATHYGKGCKMQCSITCEKQQCDRENGNCGSCIAGKIGPFCGKDCSKTTYGPGCTQQCSSTCSDGECNGINGTCNNCPDGKEGDQCEKDCDAKFYGPRCVNRCLKSCVDELCNRINGTCNTCPSGMTGNDCQAVCSPTTYGPRCIHQCRATCVDSKCNGSTGFCNQCHDRKLGNYCDRDCYPGKYGPKCAYNCSENCGGAAEDCDSLNGTCLEGCKPGYTADLCNKNCEKGKYGHQCTLSCSPNCKVPEVCDPKDGRCTSGCSDGYIGDLCNDTDCPEGRYGTTCDKTCNQNCRDRVCDSLTGQCSVGCVPGYSGTMCQQECEPGKYGTDCRSDCSEFCNTNRTRENESPCHPVSGTCLYGCVQGYQGPACDTKPQSLSSSDSESGVGVGVGIGVGVCVLVAVAIVGIYFYRRRQLAQRAVRERPPGYDPTEPTTEEHNYSELFKSEDGYNLPTDEVSSPATLNVTSKTSAHDVVQYVNAEGKAEVNMTPYEDIDQVTSEMDQGKSAKAGENNSGYANA